MSTGVTRQIFFMGELSNRRHFTFGLAAAGAVPLAGRLPLSPANAVEMAAHPAPVAPVMPKIFKTFGDVRIDNYDWLRDRKDPRVIAYLNSENAYTDTRLEPIVARGLVLLHGIGTGPFHHGIRGRGGTIFRATLPGGRSKRTHELTSSIVPRGTPFRRVVELEFPPVVIGSTSLSCHCGFAGPAEFSAISPNAVHDYGQPSRQRDNRSFHPAPSGNLHRPGLEPRPFCRT
jgi:Prolyl oligopeptidase, N-terminal beta-propeller domain